MKRIRQKIAAVVGFLAVSCVVVHADEAEFERRLQILEQRLQEQEHALEVHRNEISALKEELKKRSKTETDDIRTVVEKEVKESIADFADEHALAQIKDVRPLLAFGKHLERITFKNDLRLRVELNDENRADGDRNRERMRFRLRVGAVYHMPDWDIGLQLASGDAATAPAVGGGTSRNETFGDSFARDEFRIDRIYVKYNGIDDVGLLAGKMPNPFVPSSMIMDSDLNPEGLAAAWTTEAGFARTGLFIVNSDGYDASNGSGDADGYLYVLQGGVTPEVGDTRMTLGLSWYQFNHAVVRDVVGIDDADYDIRIGEVFADAKIDLGGASLKLFAQYIRNFGADSTDGAVGSTQTGVATEDPKDNDIGWLAGLKYSRDAWSMTYHYEVLEADANLGLLDDGDFGSNRRGHKISLDRKVSDFLKLQSTVYLTESIEGVDIDHRTLQLNAIFSF